MQRRWRRLAWTVGFGCVFGVFWGRIGAGITTQDSPLKLVLQAPEKRGFGILCTQNPLQLGSQFKGCKTRGLLGVFRVFRVLLMDLLYTLYNLRDHMKGPEKYPVSVE